MHIHTLEKWQHSHDFVVIHEKGEKRTRQVLVLTAITMTAEIMAGFAFGSMALLSDGWHMGTHSVAFAITLFAYHYSKKHVRDNQFTFGTGKVSVLGGFASAIALICVAVFMALESIQRFINPTTIHFNEAIAVAVLGLAVNIICAFLLYGHHDSSHSEKHHHDHNIRGAYLHVIADALTSMLAIVALVFGKYFGWNWLDPLMGIVGALLISRWSYGLIAETSSILLDKNIVLEKTREIINAIESDSDNRISDIHVWKIGPADYAAMISLVTHFPKNSEYYKNLLSKYEELSHITIEVNHCDEEPCITPT
ncbi:MAG: CDF family Co(II)/Ni(II) efflux transporter DmeF [Nitrospiraceae bacterium]|nr:MAG: CDF family Co(II)/Ni(II) efflux transporter DmeF [Nitrospiraceae bacterium]